MTRAARVCALVLASACLARAAGADATLREGRFRVGAVEAPPADAEAGWAPVHLPDPWPATRPDASGPGWYRLALELDAPPAERQAVYIEHASMNAAVWVNGEWIGSGGRMRPPVAQNWNRPLLFDFSPRLLRAGENVVHVQLYRLPDCYGGLGPVRVGALAALAPLHDARFFWQVELPRAGTLVSGMVALAMLAFWLGSRDPAYAAFAAVSALLGVGGLNYHVRDIPLASRTWEALVCVAGLLAAPAFALFAHRLAGWRRARLEAAFGVSGAASLALFAVDHGVFHPLYNALGAAALAICAWSLAPLLSHARRHDRALLFVHPCLGAAILSILGHDLAVQLGWVGQPAPQLLPFVAPLLVGGLGAMLTRRFVRAFRTAEGRLAASTARLRAFERERVLAQERERIVREMHDGLGGHLVRTLSMVERRGASPGEIAESLRAALDDMRLVLDSLDPGAQDLAAVLAQLRDRLGPRVERCGVRFEWAVRDLPHPPLSAEALLDVLRILQEAVTNVLRHARATRIRVATREQAGEGGRPGIAVEVSDDGVGIAPGAAAGRGIANMTFRAGRLGGALRIGPAEAGPGTRVELWLPLAPARGARVSPGIP